MYIHMYSHTYDRFCRAVFYACAGNYARHPRRACLVLCGQGFLMPIYINSETILIRVTTVSMRSRLVDVVTPLLVAAVLGTFGSHQSSALNEYSDQCQTGFQTLTVNNSDGSCTGNYTVLSCFGRCPSSAKPKFYLNR